MKLTTQEKNNIIQSMNELKTKNVDISFNFYDIFLKNEEVAVLFKNVPLKTQQEMFKVSLESIIYFMDNPNQVKIELSEMGRRHKRYGVKKYHVPIFKDALLEAINKSFDGKLNDETTLLWGKVIDMIVEALGQEL